MIHWTKFVFAVALAFSLSQTVLGCYDDANCGYGECCQSGVCNTCDSESSSVSTGIIAVIIVVAVIFKVTFWILYCYCRRRRAGVILVANPYAPFHNTASTVVVTNQTNSSTMYPPQASYPAPQQQPGYTRAQPPPHSQQQPGFPFPKQTISVRENIAMTPGNVAPPPAYTETIQSWTVSCTIIYILMLWWHFCCFFSLSINWECIQYDTIL